MAYGDEYIARIQKIWTLTDPPLQHFDKNAQLYEKFRLQYADARRLSAENNTFFRSELLPCINSSELLTEKQVEDLSGLADRLISLPQLELIDRTLSMKLHERLLRDARSKADRTRTFLHLTELVHLYYHMSVLLNRFDERRPPEIVMNYMRPALRNIDELQEWLPLERFRTLTDYEKKCVLTVNRLKFLFIPGDTAKNFQLKLQAAQQARLIATDPEYRAAYPAGTWEKEYACRLYYVTICSEFLEFSRDDDPEDFRLLMDAATEQLEETRAGRMEYISLSDAEQIYNHMRQLCGIISRNDYLNILYAQYDLRDPSRHDATGIIDNVLRAAQINEILEPNVNENPDYPARLSQLYRNIVNYALFMPNSDCQELFLNYSIAMLGQFAELPGSTSFAHISDMLMANCSPATYVHVQMVGRIAQEIGNALIDRQPERFIGLCGCKNVQQVQIRRQRILHLLYECGIYHDIGKLPYLDTIGVTYRSFFPEEMTIVRMHSLAGYQLLNAHESTRIYAPVALGHHRWYNGEGGYPDEFNRDDCEFPVLVDIIAVADCMDAATDTVFRSYNPGISLKKYIDEVNDGAGTRYAPFIAALLKDADIQAQLEKLLSTGRPEAYEYAYKMYRSQINQSGMDTGASTDGADPESPKKAWTQPELDAAFESLFAQLERSDSVCEEFRLLVLNHINNDSVREDYVNRFREIVTRHNYLIGRVIDCIMTFWQRFSYDMDAALEATERGLELARGMTDYVHTDQYLSLLNNAVLGNVIRKNYVAAYRYALMGLSSLNEHMSSLNTYYALLNNTAMILTDIGLLGKARKQLEESMTGLDQMPPKNAITTRYRYAELLMSMGEYDAAQAIYLEMLAGAHRGGNVEPWQLTDRLVLLAYRRKNGIAIRYWHDEMERALSSMTDEEIGNDAYSVMYARAAYYAWSGQYEEASSAFDELVSQVDDTLLDLSPVLRDAAEFYDSYGAIEKSHPLYMRLYGLQRNAMKLVDEITAVDNEIIQQDSSRRAYEHLFTNMKIASDIAQNLAGCEDYDDIYHKLLRGLDGIIHMDALVLLIRTDYDRFILHPHSDGTAGEIGPDHPVIRGHGKLTQPTVIAMNDSFRNLFPASALESDGSIMLVPLIAQDMSQGYLVMYSGSLSAFDQSSQSIASTLGIGISVAVRNIRRYMLALSQANHDPLTGIANRSYFASEASKRIRDSLVPLGLYMLDIDNFKAVNDTYGHDIGDRVLCRLAHIINNLRSDILAARYGGEEFILLAPLHKGDDLLNIGRHICLTSESTHYFDGQAAPITVSVGACVWDVSVSLPDMLKHADEQMYTAKRTGKNRICILENP